MRPLARRFADSIRTGSRAISSRPGRSALMAIGVAVGVGSYVMATGLATTIRAQVSSEFDIRLATQVVAFEAEGNPLWTLETVPEAVGHLAGVESAVLIALGAVEMSQLESSNVGLSTVSAVAATAELLEAAETDWHAGNGFVEVRDTGQRVVAIGIDLAARLGPTPPTGRVMYLDGIAHSVVGVVGPTPRLPEIDQSVILPWSERANYALRDARLFARVAPGAALSVADRLALAAAPNQPQSISTIRPLDPRELREEVDQQLQQFLTAIGAVALILSAIAILNSALVSVGQRTPEIGLNRAFGVSRSEIFIQFLHETSIVGMVAGIVGVGLAVTTLAVLSWANQWQPVMPPHVPLVGFLLGIGVGIVAGSYPALIASRVSPITAIRSAEGR